MQQIIYKCGENRYNNNEIHHLHTPAKGGAILIRNIAAIVSGMDEEYPYYIINGINDFARAHDINVSYFAAFGGIIESKDFDLGEFGIYSLADFSKFDGAILLSNTFANLEARASIVRRVREAGIPAVVFECQDYEDFYDISIDNYSVMKKLVEHLIQVHHARTFHFIAGPASNPEAVTRYRAFLDALQENGLSFDSRRFFQGRFRSYDGIRAIEAFLESGLDLPDAFVCANDSMALAAMNKLQRLGYRIPEDVLITGFDNTFNAQSSYPVLTTVKRPLYESGVKSCSLLYDLMNGLSHEKTVMLEAEPVFTQSCGCEISDFAYTTEYQKTFSLRLERTYLSVHILNRLIAGLAGAQNIEDCVNAIRQLIKALDFEQFSLCLVEDWERNHRTLSVYEGSAPHPELMTAPFIWNKGRVSSVESFSSAQLFPEPPTTGGNISYFLPLHFDERYLGYTIITNNDFPISSFLCHTMSLSIGNAIESVSKLNVLDPLCKVYNRNGFTQNAEQLFKTCIAQGEAVMISFIDLDDLKKINDNFGHKEGDFAIQQMASAISSCCRGGTDICARFGGDEFVVMCVNIPDHFPGLFEERLLHKIDAINARASKPYRLSASIGSVMKNPTASDKLLDMIQEADAKMYKVKKSHKNAASSS